ncbi:MAG: D-alanyl-D-alanine carboxypeptidase [Tissierellia bacterium]|nr:D-alanyl-D-alanine carboxypeptidase [Tissierellia bacterium]
MNIKIKTSLRKVILLLIFISLTLNIIYATEKKELKLKSLAAIVIDAENGRVLYEKEGYSKRKIASLTKMITAIVTVENAKMSNVVTIKTASSVIGGSTIGMKKGDKITVEALMYGMLLESGNDCAYALGEYIGGDTESFGKMMTEKAKEIGAKDSAFKNPHGLDAEGHYSTAYDMAIITRYALSNNIINKIVGTNTIEVKFGNTPKYFSNTNRLLRTYAPTDGGKTGFTNGANRCLIASATRNGFRVITVVLGAETTDIRFDDAKTLLEYALNNYTMKDISKNMNWYINIPIIKGKIDHYEKYITREMRVALTEEEYEKIYIKQTILPIIHAPAKKGYNLGKIELYIDNERIYEENIILSKSIEKKNTLDYMKYGIKNMFKLDVKLI